MPTKIFLVFFLIVQFAYNQEIRVYNARDLKPIAGCLVITGQDTVRTDVRGFCNIDQTARDSLLIEAEGYLAARTDHLKYKSVAIYLQPVESTPEIIIVASARKPVFLPASTDIINIAGGDKARAVSAVRVLKEEAGIAFKSYGGDGQLQNITLRGFSAEQTQVLFDGIPMNNLQLGLLNFSNVSLSQLSRVEIYKGGSPLFGGSGAIGGMINFKPLAVSDKFTFNLAQSFSSLNNLNTSADINIPLFDFYQNINLNLASGKNDYSAEREGQKVKLRNRDFKSRNLQWQGEYNLLKDLSANLLIRHYTFDGGSPGPFTGPASEPANEARIAFNNTLTRLRLKKKMSVGNMIFQVYRRNEWNTYNDPGKTGNSLHFNREGGLQLRTKYFLSDHVLINSGVEYARQGVNSSDLGKKSRERYAVYGLADWLLNSTLNTVPDLNLYLSTRFEKVNAENVFLPGVGISAVWDYFNIFASVGRNYRAPDFNEMYWPGVGDSNLKPEKSSNMEAGVAYKNNLDNIILNSSATFYYTSVHNQIKWLPVGSDEFVPQNIVEISSKGLELKTDISAWQEFFNLIINYNYNDARKTKAEFPGDRTKGNRVPYTALHNLFINCFFNYRNFMFGGDLDFRSYRYPTFANDNTNYLPSVGITSLKMSYSHPFKNGISATLFFFIENLANENYQLYSGYPMPPRTYKLNLTIHY